MLPVSLDYQAKIKDTVRTVKGRVQIDYTDPFIDQSITATVNGENNISAKEQTANGVKQPPRKWIALDGTWVLNGTFYAAPADKSEQIGWWGNVLSNSVDGTFVTFPTLTIEFFSRPIHRLMVFGDNLKNEFPVDFDIKLINSAGTVLYTETVTGNNVVDWSKDINTVNQVVKMTLEIKKWSQPRRVVKILEFFTSVQEIYESDDVISINLLEERDISNGSLPIGNISANEIAVRLNNIDRKFDAGNSQSPLYQLLKANRRIKAWIGLQLPSTVEWLPLGVFYSGDWNVPEDEVFAETTGRDRLELLRKSTYSISQVKVNTNLHQLALDVLQDAGLTSEQYWVDVELQNYAIPYAWFNPVSHREALRQIAEACLGQCFCDRNGVIRLEGPSFLKNERIQSQLNITMDDYFSKDQPVRWSEIANYIEVETNPLRPAAIEEVFRSNDPVPISAGETQTTTIYYNEAPVIEATASIEGTGTIQNITYYAWGANVTVTSSTSGEYTLVISGKPLKVLNKQRAIAQDSDSIIDNGRLRFKFPDNHLIQRYDIAQSIANQLLASFKNPRRDIDINWRGNPALELGDRITAPDFKEQVTADFHVVSQTLEFDGGLSSTIRGRRAN